MEIDDVLVNRLIAEQFPQWADLPIQPVQPSGWDNRTFRLGDVMTVRLPSAPRYAAQVEKEQRWLPRLGPHLPFAIPTPLAMGQPTDAYPWYWSIYHWIDGETAAIARIDNLSEFAVDLAQFLNALQQVDASDGPQSGLHNFYRGGSLRMYDEETQHAMSALEDMSDIEKVVAVWEAALNTTWNKPPVWIHGDVHPTNLLMKDGQLHAVIDFGCLGVGDPACDLVIAWTLFSGQSRADFFSNLQVDCATWSRARGWALWKAVITLADHTHTNPAKVEEARRVIREVLADNDR